MENSTDSPLLQQSETLAEGRVLVLHGVAGAATGAGVHPDVSLISREGPEHESLLDRLRYPGKSLLNSLKWDSFGDKLGGNVEESAGRLSLLHMMMPLLPGSVSVRTMSLVTMMTRDSMITSETRHLLDNNTGVLDTLL